MNEYESHGMYSKYDGHVTHEMLNEAYGHAGMFFKSRDSAELHQMKMGGVIYPISDYYSTQVLCEFSDPAKKSYRVVVEKGAKRHLVGYYVSHPPAMNAVVSKVKYRKR